MRILFVHVGKTGGSTIFENIAAAPLNFTIVHGYLTADTMDEIVEDYDMYLISTREPISRTVSAFNWNHFDGGGTWYGFGHEGQIFLDNTTRDDWLIETIVPDTNQSILGALSTCFPALPGGVNAFAEALASEGTCADIARRALSDAGSGSGHLAKDHAWYLTRTPNPTSSSSVINNMRLDNKHVFHVSNVRVSPALDRRYVICRGAAGTH